MQTITDRLPPLRPAAILSSTLRLARVHLTAHRCGKIVLIASGSRISATTRIRPLIADDPAGRHSKIRRAMRRPAQVRCTPWPRAESAAYTRSRRSPSRSSRGLSCRDVPGRSATRSRNSSPIIIRQTPRAIPPQPNSCRRRGHGVARSPHIARRIRHAVPYVPAKRSRPSPSPPSHRPPRRARHLLSVAS